MGKAKEWLMSDRAKWFVLICSILMILMSEFVIITESYNEGFKSAKAIYEQRCEIIKTYTLDRLHEIQGSVTYLEERMYGALVTTQVVCYDEMNK